jgi:hypothetical protein
MAPRVRATQLRGLAKFHSFMDIVAILPGITPSLIGCFPLFKLFFGTYSYYFHASFTILSIYLLI